jgi:hypothetical protein
MKYVLKPTVFFAIATIVLLNFNSCSKSSPDPAPNPTDPCAGKIISLTATPTASTGCTNNGSILASATGSAGFTFKLNSAGAYQASGSFTNLASGSYTIFAKDADGCEKSTTVTVSAGTAGTLFNQVKTLIAAKCQSCHNNTVQNGGMNWAVDCNIVTNQARIKVRAVDEGTMPAGGPPLTTGEKAIITNWITAGGLLTN